jgi:hypothetical protein
MALSGWLVTGATVWARAGPLTRLAAKLMAKADAENRARDILKSSVSTLLHGMR